MSKQRTSKPPVFSVGSRVRLKRGVVDPEYPDMPLGGWLGTVVEIEEGSYLVRWDQTTLEAVHPIYRERCERDGVDFTGMWLQKEELEADAGGPLRIEQFTKIVGEPASLDEQEDRIRTVFGLIGDEPIPDVDGETLLVFYTHLMAHASLPFEAKYSKETGPAWNITSAITVLGLTDPGKYPDEDYGLFCTARQSKRTIELPLADVEVDEDNPQLQVFDDYAYWFANWR
jgi:hypothetical protein